MIVFGSHADQITAMGKDPRAKESIFAPIIKKFPKFELTGFIPMDCHFADSDDKNKKTDSEKLCYSPLSRNHQPECSPFYIYLAENFKDDLAVSLNVVPKANTYSNLEQTHGSKKMTNILSFIPTTHTHLVDICDQLSKTGLLLFLQNESSPENSFLICDSTNFSLMSLGQCLLLSTFGSTVISPKVLEWCLCPNLLKLLRATTLIC